MKHHQDSLGTTLGNTIFRDVTLRDGLQLTGKLLFTELKVETVRELGEPNRSKAAQGARSRAEAFDWILPADSAAPDCTTGGN